MASHFSHHTIMSSSSHDGLELPVEFADAAPCVVRVLDGLAPVAVRQFSDAVQDATVHFLFVHMSDSAFVYASDSPKCDLDSMSLALMGRHSVCMTSVVCRSMRVCADVIVQQSLELCAMIVCCPQVGNRGALPHGSTLLGTDAESFSALGMAQRLAKKTGLAVFVSLNVSAPSPLLEAWLEKRILRELSEANGRARTAPPALLGAPPAADSKADSA
jgi:hypothetical protein